MANISEAEQEKRDAYYASVMKYFAGNVAKSFCIEDFLSSEGYSLEQQKGIWEKASHDQQYVDQEYADIPLADLPPLLRKGGYEQLASFVEEYIAQGGRGLRERTRSQVRDVETPVKPIEKKPTEHKETMVGLNLLSNQEATIKALVAMEGQEWLDTQREYAVTANGGQADEYDVDGVIEALKRGGKHGVIYGRGGMNRYIVNARGEVTFSKTHGSSEKARKAAELGFRVE